MNKTTTLTIEQRPKMENVSINAGGRIIARNHPSRAKRMSEESLREIAKGCYTKYVSPFKKFDDC